MKKVAFLTVIAILLAIVFLLGKALFKNVSQPTDQYAGSDPTKWGLPKTSREIVAKRSATAKHFKNEDGTYTSVISVQPLHYKDHSGTLQEIELSFAKQGDAYISEKNLAKTVVEQNRLTTVDPQTGKGIAWIIPTHFTIENNEAKYEENGITWKYTLTATGTKLSATVEERQGTQTYTYKYELIGGAKDLKVDEATGNLIGDGFTIPRAFVIGKNGQMYEASSWVLTNKSQISFTFDDTSLPDEAFPYVIDPTTSFTVQTSSDDGYAYGTSATYPPTSGTSASTTLPNVNVIKSIISSQYQIHVGLIRWDTSSIPDDSTVTAATFRFVATGWSNTNSRSLTAEWYSSANWPIDVSNYTSVVGTNAHSGYPISSVQFLADNDMILSNAPANINKTGYTGLRLHISGTTPTGQNQVLIGSFDDGSVTPPRLIVDYTEPPTPTPTNTPTPTPTRTPTPTPTPTNTPPPTPTPTPPPGPIYFEGVNLDGININ